MEMEGTLFQGVVFIIAVVIICVLQWVRYNIVAAGHKLLVKSKSAAGV